jgi:hypothetical protein
MGYSTDLLHFLLIWLQLHFRLTKADIFTRALSTIGDTADNVLGRDSIALGVVSFTVGSVFDLDDAGGTVVAIGVNDRGGKEVEAVRRIFNYPLVCSTDKNSRGATFE